MQILVISDIAGRLDRLEAALEHGREAKVGPSSCSVTSSLLLSAAKRLPRSRRHQLILTARLTLKKQ